MRQIMQSAATAAADKQPCFLAVKRIRHASLDFRSNTVDLLLLPIQGMAVRIVDTLTERHIEAYLELPNNQRKRLRTLRRSHPAWTWTVANANDRAANREFTGRPGHQISDMWLVGRFVNQGQRSISKACDTSPWWRRFNADRGMIEGMDVSQLLRLVCRPAYAVTTVLPQLIFFNADHPEVLLPVQPDQMRPELLSDCMDLMVDALAAAYEQCHQDDLGWRVDSAVRKFCQIVIMGQEHKVVKSCPLYSCLIEDMDEDADAYRDKHGEMGWRLKPSDMRSLMHDTLRTCVPGYVSSSGRVCGSPKGTVEIMAASLM